MKLPAKKRKAFRTMDYEGAAAELNPLSSSAPVAKRHSGDSPKATEPSEMRILNQPAASLEASYDISDVLLGSGEYGKVRECWDRATGEMYACKSIRKTRSKAQHKEIRNEVAVMTRLAGHGNIVQLRNTFEDDKEVHLVMTCCEGGELFEEIVRRERFSEQDAAHVFSEVVRAVSFCALRSVIHRDIKPENILLTRELTEGERPAYGTVKLADFGLAAHLSEGESMKGVAGSPFYIAPEVITGKYSLEADVWSLGVLLYILLSGSPPFPGDTDEEVFKATLRCQPDLRTGHWEKVSSEAKSLVRSLLARDPCLRPTAQRILSHPWLLRHVAGRGSPSVSSVSISRGPLSVPVV